MNVKKGKNKKKVYFLFLGILIIGITIEIFMLNNKYSSIRQQTTEREEKLQNIDNNINEIDYKNNLENEIVDTPEDENNTEINNNYENTDKQTNTVDVKNKYASKLKNGLPVLMYHFFYDKNKENGKDNNWMEIHDFEEQMKYLSENNFYFPTWEEVEEYIDGKVDLPEKSIVLTFDDGDDSFFELAVPIIQKYDVKATSFVITSWYGWRASDKQKNIDYQSHSDSMHEGKNGKGIILSWGHDKIVEDLKTSSQILGGATVFCYPFGHYNDTAKKALRDAGYKLAFTVEGGRVRKGDDKYALPRVRISRGIKLNTFKNMVN